MTERTSVWTRGDQEVSLARLYVIRAFVPFPSLLGNAFDRVQRMLFLRPRRRTAA